MPEQRGCEAEVHDPNCPCLRCNKKNCDGCKVLTRDHFKPKCIARLMGIRPKEVNRSENIQLLSRPCHDLKDKSTQERKKLLQRQQNGAFISLSQYKDFVRRYDTVEEKSD